MQTCLENRAKESTKGNIRARTFTLLQLNRKKFGSKSEEIVNYQLLIVNCKAPPSPPVEAPLHLPPVGGVLKYHSKQR